MRNWEGELSVVLSHLKTSEMIRINCSEATLDITKRPAYCDRGQFMLFAESKDNAILTIDFADMFPRIYFTIEAVIIELREWLKARKQEVLSIDVV